MQVADQDAGERRRSAGGISLQTLLIASVASAVTSYVVSRVWGPGTIIGAAATPVIVALVAESLRKPVQTVAATAQRVPVAQYVPVVRERARVQVDPDAPTRVAAAGEEAPTRVAGAPRPREPRAPRGPVAPPPVDPGYVAALEAEGPAPARASRTAGIRWRIVLATAAAAFAIVVAIYTVPDLVAGKSITGSGRATTIFGGSSSSGSGSTTKDSPSTTTTTETTQPKTVTSTAPATTTTVPAPTTTATTPSTSTPTPTTTTAPDATTPTTPATPTTTAPAPQGLAPPTTP